VRQVRIGPLISVISTYGDRTEPHAHDVDLVTDLPSTYREADANPVEISDAKAVWAAEARIALERRAATYNGLYYSAELAREVQDRSRIRTSVPTHRWIGDVLATVGRNCHELGEPLLSSLCVRTDGTIGAGYGAAFVAIFGGTAPPDLDQHAAEERLRCYQHFGAVLPADGGRPTLTP
jgi:hypothetical protein